MVIDAGLMPAVMERLGCGKFSVQKEAVWIVSNCLAVGTPEQVRSQLSFLSFNIWGHNNVSQRCNIMLPRVRLLSSRCNCNILYPL